MKYSLIIILVLLLCSGLSAQISINGFNIVCPDDHVEYSIYEGSCGYQVEVIEWVIDGGYVVSETDHSVLVHWDNPGVETPSVDVLYRCWPNIDPEDYYDDWAFTKDIDFRAIQTPLFGVASISIPMDENDPFVISTPNQGTGFKYSWTFPECLPGIDGSYATMVFPDLVSAGTICLTVTNTYCDETYTECIEITRSCLNSITFSEPDELPVFTSVNQFIHTSGNVETALPSVEFKAGTAINLNPGFSANADFLAHIAPCGGPEGEGCIGLETSGLVSAYDTNTNKETPSKVNINDDHAVNVLNKKDDVKMRISPNPAMDNFAITLDGFDRSQDYSFEVLSLDGKGLLKGHISDPKTFIDISSLSKGIYLVKVNTRSKISVTRLVKY